MTEGGGVSPLYEWDNYTYYGNSTNFSLSTNSTEEYEGILFMPPLEVVIVISLFYCCISLTAVVGNSTVILIVLTSRRMQSVTNYFIANLALADVIIGLFAIPFQFQAALLQRWNLPPFLCPFCPFFQNLSVNASIFTLTAIAVDRYKAIMHPLKNHASKSRTKGVIVVIWVVTMFLADAMADAFRTVDINAPYTPELLQCLPVHTKIYQLEVFMWYKNALCLVQYFIPLTIISGAYIRMAVCLWSARTPGAAQLDRDRQVVNNKKKVIKMLMMVVALFTLAWLPLQLYDVLSQIFQQINLYPYINIIWFCMHWLAMSNSCYNPFIYLLLNDKFQKELRLKVACCFGPPPPNNGHMTDTSTNMVLKSGDTFRRRRLRGQVPTTQVENTDDEMTMKTSITPKTPNAARNNNISFEFPAKAESNGYTSRRELLLPCAPSSHPGPADNRTSDL